MAPVGQAIFLIVALVGFYALSNLLVLRWLRKIVHDLLHRSGSRAPPTTAPPAARPRTLGVEPAAAGVALDHRRLVGTGR
jgi:hypothetical protein